jgi:hypothetical protein
MSPFSSDESPVAAARRCGRRFCTPNAVFGAATATIRYEGRGFVLLFGPGQLSVQLGVQTLAAFISALLVVDRLRPVP